VPSAFDCPYQAFKLVGTIGVVTDELAAVIAALPA
jgi:hypothetical protein